VNKLHEPGLQLDNKVSQSTNQQHGTVCHLHYGHGPVGERLQMGTEDAPVLDRPASLRHLHDPGAGYKYPNLLTYLLSNSAILLCAHHRNDHHLLIITDLLDII